MDSNFTYNWTYKNNNFKSEKSYNSYNEALTALYEDFYNYIEKADVSDEEYKLLTEGIKKNELPFEYEIEYDINEDLNESREINFDDDLIRVYLNGKEVFKGYAEDWCDENFYDNFTWTGKQYEATNEQGKWVVKVLEEELEEIDDIKKVDEDIEAHTELNPKLFNGNELKEDVRNKIIEIVNKFTKSLTEDKIYIKVSKIILVGSNVNYNYTKDSDLDVHIYCDMKECKCPDNLYPLLYSAYRSLFNSKHDISFYGIPVELYVQPEEELVTLHSNGLYDVINNKWLREPVRENIPEIDLDEFNKEFKVWEDKYLELIRGIPVETSVEIKETLESGEREKIDLIDNFITDIYKLRQESVSKEGEFGIGNLIFKEFRNKGYLDNLKEIKWKLSSKDLSLEGLEEELDYKKYPRAPENDLVKEAKKIIKKNNLGILNSADGEFKGCMISPIKESGDEGVYIFTITGGKNGSGDTLDYLKDLRSCIKDLRKVFKFSTYLLDYNLDVADDLFLAHIGCMPRELKDDERLVLEEKLIVNHKAPLLEGCWKVPYSTEEAKELKELFKNKIPLNKVGDIRDGDDKSKHIDLHIGDDSLFDILSTERTANPDGDARPAIRMWLRDNVVGHWDEYDPYNKETDPQTGTPFTEEAMNAIMSIVDGKEFVPPHPFTKKGSLNEDLIVYDGEDGIKDCENIVKAYNDTKDINIKKCLKKALATAMFQTFSTYGNAETPKIKEWRENRFKELSGIAEQWSRELYPVEFAKEQKEREEWEKKKKEGKLTAEITNMETGEKEIIPIKSNEGK